MASNGKKKVGKILLIVFLVPAVLILDLTVFAAADAFGGGEVPQEIDGYAAFYPQEGFSGSGANILPAVMLIHEFWGLNPEHREKAQILANQGFVVYAPDAYGGDYAQTVPGALLLMISKRQSAIDRRMDKTWNAMLADGRVDPDRSAVAGFCFGGRQSLLFGIRHLQPSAVVSFYGSGMPTDSASLGFLGVDAPVLGIYGEEDASIPAESREAFANAMDEAGREYTEVVYSGVGHAFVKADTLDGPGAPGEAWQLFLDFLRDM